MSTWPSTMEIIGLTGAVDYVEFTSQYAPYDLYALENLARAAELYHLSTMIKIDAEPRTYLAQRAIGTGFQSILFADLRSVNEVESAIKAVRAEPKGWNGSFDDRAEGYLFEGGSKKFAKYCDDIVVAVMMEKKSLYEQLEDVLNLDGLDMVQFGPSDFAMSMGLWGQTDNPKIREAQERTIRLAARYDRHPRAELGGSVDQFQAALKKYAAMGVQDFAIGTDIQILFDWITQFGGLTRKFLKRD